MSHMTPIQRQGSLSHVESMKSAPKVSEPSTVVRETPVKETPPTPVVDKVDKSSKAPTPTVDDQIQGVTPPKMRRRAKKLPETSVSLPPREETLKTLKEQFTFTLPNYDPSKLKVTSMWQKLFGFNRNNIQFQETEDSTRVGKDGKPLKSVGLSRALTAKALFLMKWNPRSNPESRREARMFMSFASTEYSSENPQYLSESRDLSKIIDRHGLDSAEASKQMKFLYLHYMATGSDNELNIASDIRSKSESAYKELLKAESDFKSNPSLENETALKDARTKMLSCITQTNREIYSLIGDTFGRYANARSTFHGKVNSTKQGRIWREFKLAHKRFVNGPQFNAQGTRNFFASWGKFNKAVLNVFFLNAMTENPEDLDEQRAIKDIQDKKGLVKKFSDWEQGTVRKTPEDYGL